MRPDQCTLVPVQPGEITSQAGWPIDTPAAEMRAVVSDLRDRGVRVSLFVDPESTPWTGPPRWAPTAWSSTPSRSRGPSRRAATRWRAASTQYVAAAGRAHDRGLGVNAGHDLDLDNLPIFRRVPHLDEVSIGHALVSRALFVGLDRVVREYLTVLEGETVA